MMHFRKSAVLPGLATWVMLPLAGLFAQQASAEMLVQSLEGDAAGYQLIREGRAQPLLPLSVLKAGDVVKVQSPQGGVTLAGGDGEVIVVGAADSPFEVPQEAARSWMDNAMLAALEWYQGVSSSDAQTVSLVTRGASHGGLQLQGMAVRKNRVPAGMAPLQFRWSGGRAPFRVTIQDAGKRLLVDAEVEEHAFSYSGEGLPEGRYIVRVEGQGAKALRAHEQVFTVTNRTALPPEVVQLDDRAMPATLRQHLSAVMLARYPEWRFTALQLALSSGDQKLSQLLLSGMRGRH